jgi:hypothetical protein
MTVSAPDFVVLHLHAHPPALLTGLTDTFTCACRPNWRWLNLTTLHWYKATRENGDTVQTLLDEAPLRSEMANLKQLVDVSKK